MIQQRAAPLSAIWRENQPIVYRLIMCHKEKGIAPPVLLLYLKCPFIIKKNVKAKKLPAIGDVYGTDKTGDSTDAAGDAYQIFRG